MTTGLLEKPILGRPTNERIAYLKDVHDYKRLLASCHQRVVALENRVILLSNLAQQQKLELNMFMRNANTYNRI